MNERFKIARGRMLVVAPGEKPAFRPVKLIYDSVNDMVGIQLIGESQLKGWCFYIAWDDFGVVKARGKLVDVVRVE